MCEVRKRKSMGQGFGTGMRGVVMVCIYLIVSIRCCVIWSDSRRAASSVMVENVHVALTPICHFL